MSQPPHHFEKRIRIFNYVAPQITLFPTQFALIFGTRHGVDTFADEILSQYRQGYFATAIISGGNTAHCSESEGSVISNALLTRGVPERALVLEGKAVNAGENVAFARESVKGLNITELLLIGKISSKRRYMMTVKKQWPEIRKVCCHGVNYFSRPEELWWKDSEFKRRVISEYRKFRFILRKASSLRSR